MQFLEEADIPDPCAGGCGMYFAYLFYALSILTGYLIKESSLAGSLALVLQR